MCDPCHGLGPLHSSGEMENPFPGCCIPAQVQEEDPLSWGQLFTVGTWGSIHFPAPWTEGRFHPRQEHPCFQHVA